MSNGLANPEGHEDSRVVQLLTQRLYVEDDDELIKRLLGALLTVLLASGERGERAFIEYAERF